MEPPVSQNGKSYSNKFAPFERTGRSTEVKGATGSSLYKVVSAARHEVLRYRTNDVDEQKQGNCSSGPKSIRPSPSRNRNVNNKSSARFMKSALDRSRTDLSPVFRNTLNAGQFRLRSMGDFRH